MAAFAGEWIDISAEEPMFGPPCPAQCEAGVVSHRWTFEWSAFNGASLSTKECPICDRGVNGLELGDWPHEYLTIELDVTLEAFTEVYGYETPEYDHYVVMTPVAAK